MSKRSMCALILVSLAVLQTGFGKEKDGKGATTSRGPQKTTGTPVFTYMNINNISTVLRNNGTADINPSQTNAGLVFPRGSGRTAVYESGLLWAARIAGDPQVRVGGSAYTSGLQPGKLVSPGVSEDPNLPKNRIYRVRPDYRTADLSAEVFDEGASAAQVRAQYELDWNEWPVADGAPYVDVDNNGIYNPAVDVPGVKGASQTIWFVANDDNPTNVSNLYGAQPLGVEVQVTAWAYAQEGALNNMLFKSYLLINKSPRTFDSMYVCQWSDPDLGFANDDYVGCDTSLSLGFVYNANNVDQVYGSLPPPAAGFDFFQGPRVPSAGGTAIFRGKQLAGYRNLPMTSFFYFINSDPTLADPTKADPSGSTQFYNYMRGRVGLTGQTFRDPQGNPTPFTLTGDPVKGTGWLDGQQYAADDRRLGLSSGPFQMAPGDTQEIVVAEIVAGAAPGVDRLTAVSLLKFYDKVAQLTYDNLFSVPAPPPSPRVELSELDRQLVLDWGSNAVAVNATETSDNGGFRFQGYNVYQLPSASAGISQGRKIAVFDLPGDGITRITDQVFDPSIGVITSKVVQLGTDSGIKRFLRLTGDVFKGGTPLINGIRYYFAVTAYSYSTDPNAIPNNLESSLQVFTAVPHSTTPGTRLQAGTGDTVATANGGTGPKGDGRAVVQVVDPARVSGHRYRVDFEGSGDSTTWKLTDVTTNQVRVSGQVNQSGDDTSPIVDGLMVRVFGPANDFKRFSMVSNGAGAVTANTGFDFTPAPAAPAYSADWYRDVVQGAASILDLPNGMQTAGGWYFLVAPPDVGDYNTAIGRWTRDGSRWARIVPNDYEIRFTAAGGKAVWPSEFLSNATPGTYNVPFELWYTGVGTPNDPSDDVRMIPVIFEGSDTAAGVPSFGFQLDHAASGGNNDPYSDWIYFYMPADRTPGSAGYQAAMAANPTTRDAAWQEHIARVVLMNWNEHQGGADPVAAQPETGTVFRIESTKPSRAVFDAFTFTAPAVSFSTDVAKMDIAKINVFPNPYYGVNTEEINKYNRFVTFTHLPHDATIKVFSLAGVQVREIHKSSDTQFERWDLANESGLPVGSGLYIVHIEMPGLDGATKILKLAIVQEQQILDRF
jgi:hypothetical protein